MSAFLTISKHCEMENLVIDATGFDYGILITCADVDLYKPKVFGAKIANIQVLNWDEKITDVRMFSPNLFKSDGFGLTIRGEASYISVFDAQVSSCGLHGLSCIDSPQIHWSWEPAGDEFRAEILLNNKDIKRVYLKGDRSLTADEWYVDGNYLYLSKLYDGVVVASVERTHHISFIRPTVEHMANLSSGYEGHGVVLDDAISNSLVIDGLVNNCAGAGYSNNAGRDNQFINCRGFGNDKLFQDIKPATGTILN